jgi:hypothetical protein
VVFLTDATHKASCTALRALGLSAAEVISLYDALVCVSVGPFFPAPAAPAAGAGRGAVIVIDAKATAISADSFSSLMPCSRETLQRFLTTNWYFPPTTTAAAADAKATVSATTPAPSQLKPQQYTAMDALAPDTIALITGCVDALLSAAERHSLASAQNAATELTSDPALWRQWFGGSHSSAPLTRASLKAVIERYRSAVRAADPPDPAQVLLIRLVPAAAAAAPTATASAPASEPFVASASSMRALIEAAVPSALLHSITPISAADSNSETPSSFLAVAVPASNARTVLSALHQTRLPAPYENQPFALHVSSASAAQAAQVLQHTQRYYTEWATLFDSAPFDI